MVYNDQKIAKFIIVRQSLASFADNFSAPYIGYYLASITPSGTIQGFLQFSTNALPTLAQITIGPLTDRYKNYVQVLLISSLAASLLWIFISLIANPIILTVLVTMRAIFVGIAGLSLTTLIGVVFSDIRRGEVLSKINAVSQLMALIAFTLTALLINPTIETLRLLFIFSGVLSFVASCFWVKLIFIEKYISTHQDNKYLGISTALKSVLRNKSFIKFSIIYSIHIAAMAFAWPLFPLMQKYVFSMTVSEIAILNICGTASLMVSQFIVTNYIHKLNIKKMIVLSRLGFTVYSLSYALASNSLHIYIANIILGPFSALSNVLIPLYVFRASMIGMYASYLATLNFMQGIAAAIGSIVGGTIADKLVMSDSFYSLRYLMLLITIFRGVTAVLLIKIDEK